MNFSWKSENYVEPNTTLCSEVKWCILAYDLNRNICIVIWATDSQKLIHPDRTRFELEKFFHVLGHRNYKSKVSLSQPRRFRICPPCGSWKSLSLIKQIAHICDLSIKLSSDWHHGQNPKQLSAHGFGKDGVLGNPNPNF